MSRFAADRSFSVDEIDRRGSSCPVLFALDGERYSSLPIRLVRRGAGIGLGRENATSLTPPNI